VLLQAEADRRYMEGQITLPTYHRILTLLSAIEDLFALAAEIPETK
jgi:hypothetical protein